jgi:single-strand DNA-binding protein
VDKGVIGMWNETKLTLVGRVCTDIDTRLTSDGTAMVFFKVAVNERKYDKQLGAYVAGNSLFMKVKCFRKLAEHVGTTLRKGDPVMVTGRIYTNRYEKDGQVRTDTELEASAIGPDLALCEVHMHRDELADRPVEVAAA